MPGCQGSRKAIFSAGRIFSNEVFPDFMSSRVTSILLSIREAQPGQQAGQVIDVVAHVVALFNQLGNPWAGPEVSCKSIGLGPLAQTPQQISALARSNTDTT